MKALLDLFDQGGPVMVVIAIISLLAWWLAIRRWLEARRSHRRPAWVNDFLQATERKDWTAASGILGDKDSVFAATLGEWLTARHLPRESSGKSVRSVAATESTETDAALRFLGALAAALPLLGLLGTVVGMLVTFEVIQTHGTGESRLMAGGIRQALLTTQAGLLAAVPVLFLHQVLRSHARRTAGEIELLVHKLQAMNGIDQG